MIIPRVIDLKYRKGKTENAIVMSCLLHSMKPEINRHYLLLKTAKWIWDSVAKTYSKMGNTAKVYELKQSISQLHQGNLPLATFYSLKEMWDYLTFKPKCKEDIIA